MHTIELTDLALMPEEGLLLGNGDFSVSVYQAVDRIIWRFQILKGIEKRMAGCTLGFEVGLEAFGGWVSGFESRIKVVDLSIHRATFLLLGRPPCNRDPSYRNRYPNTRASIRPLFDAPVSFWSVDIAGSITGCRSRFRATVERASQTLRGTSG